MGRIKILPEHLINRIAAGEVVERPVSIVKELVENSLDAGATEITVEIECGGKDSIVVRDNGSGMDEADIFMALERHATSKIEANSDLFAVSTKGFRGEAIPTIASVSFLTIKSAVEHGAGNMVFLKGGALQNSGPCSISKGTEISVQKLFFNMPVRKKFLGSDEKEFAFIKEFLQKCAMVYNNISFSLIHNTKKIFSFPIHEERLSRILSVWKCSKENLKTIFNNYDLCKIEIFAASPTGSYSGPSVFAVNERIVTDRKISAVVFKVYRELLGGISKPQIFINITIPYDRVDVNVHPSKLEVRFRDEKFVTDSIENSLRETLLLFRNKSESRIFFNSADFNRNFREKSENISDEKDLTNKFSLEKTGNYLNNFQLENISDEKKDYFQESLFSTHFSNYKVIGTAFSLYIIIEMGDALYFLDQHASHERITYKKLTEGMRLKSGLTQMQIEPSIIKVSPEELIIFTEHKSIFDDTGFILEQFDEESLVLRGVPSLCIVSDWVSLVKEIIREIKEKGFSTAFDERYFSFVASRACKSSVKYNDNLSAEEIESLINDINLQETLTCPHGRPFFFAIKKSELEKQVKR